ncbi:HD domain-containing phosphohydrolase [Planctomycetota bacterium]
MKKNILFVDDEPNVLKGIERMLHAQREEWVLNTAQSVDAALDLIVKAAFDVIVSDVSMPGKDGFELLRNLHESDTTKDIPVIILTGNKEHSLKRRALEMGATDLLDKPVIREDLLARLRSVLRLKSNQDDLKAHNNLLEQKVRERTAELEESRLDIIYRLGKAAEYHDEETGNHILRVGCYCRAIAQEMDRSRDFAEMIFLTSPMHDIGKIGISDLILMKPGRLTAEERKIMERHCVIGYEILTHEPKGLKPFLKWHRDYTVLRRSKNPILEMAAAIALGHHERWDGTGYPQQLKGTDTPLAARIAALADVYDALRTERPYKEAFSEEKTLAIMWEEEKKHFDPEVFAAFEGLTDIFNDIHGQFSDKAAEEQVLQKR